LVAGCTRWSKVAFFSPDILALDDSPSNRPEDELLMRFDGPENDEVFIRFDDAGRLRQRPLVAGCTRWSKVAFFSPDILALDDSPSNRPEDELLMRFDDDRRFRLEIRFNTLPSLFFWRFEEI